MTLARKQVLTGDFTCLNCGHAVNGISTPVDDTMTLEEGQQFSCGACGAGHVIVPDGLALVEGDTPEAREQRLRYWATQRG